MLGLKITEYELLHCPNELSIRLKLRYGMDCERWSISRGESALCKIPNQHGFYEFHDETLPSNRDEKYYEQYRFSSASTAILFWKANRQHILATVQEQIPF